MAPKKRKSKGTPRHSHGLAKHEKEIRVNDLRRELVSALYVDRETLKAAFHQMLADRPYDAFRVLVSLMPREVAVVETKTELPPLVQSIRAAMADVAAIVEVRHDVVEGIKE